MADQREPVSATEEACVAATAAARRHVAAAYDLTEVSPTMLPDAAVRRHRAVWRVTLGHDDVPVEYVLVAIPWTFPDELPDIYLPSAVTRNGARIPHLDAALQLCTFDDGVAWPNPERPGESVCAVVDRAVQLMRDGLSGANSGDYAGEFEAYWIDGAKRLDLALSDVPPDGPHRRIVSLPFSPALGGHSRIFAETEGAAIALAEALGHGVRKPDPSPALYLHLGGLGTLHAAMTNGEIYARLSSDPSAQAALLTFLRDVPRPATVLFSIPAGDGRVFGAWVHPRYRTDIYRGKNSRRVMDQMPGFRPGHLPPEVEMKTACARLQVDRIVVRRMDTARLADRTAGGAADVRGPMNLIGCGSLGGFVADTLRHARPSPLRLIDPQDLEVHNVPRHLCDMTMIGTNKAKALRETLLRHDPHLDIVADERNVLDVIRLDPSSLSGAEITFVAIASLPVERRVNMVVEELSLGTVVYIWIEPHAVAGHAVVVPAGVAGCFECLLGPALHLTVGVLTSPEHYEKADAGCRGSYLPYSGLDAATFARAVTQAVLRYQGTSSTILTWIGDLDRARSEGWKIDAGWSGATPFSLTSKPLVARADCPVCRGR